MIISGRKNNIIWIILVSSSIILDENGRKNRVISRFSGSLTAYLTTIEFLLMKAFVLGMPMECGLFGLEFDQNFDG